MFVESGIHPSLDDHCQHQLVYGKMNISVPTPPPYERKIWDYSKAETGTIRDTLNSVDWNLRFSGLGSEDMVEVFTGTLHSILSSHISCQLRIRRSSGPSIRCTEKNTKKRGRPCKLCDHMGQIDQLSQGGHVKFRGALVSRRTLFMQQCVPSKTCSTLASLRQH